MISPPVTDAAFWNERPDYRAVAANFTVAYARAAWAIAAEPTGAVIDIAAGTGALAVIAADAGATVLAVDFATVMVEAITALGHPRIRARVMNGQALDVPDASFDAAFSMFGIMLFPDWRQGLTEMARVLARGGRACIGTWANASGAGPNLLLADRTTALFPTVAHPVPFPGLAELANPDRCRAALIAAGLIDVSITDITHDFVVDLPMLDDPDRLFQFSPLWPLLAPEQRAVIVASIQADVAAGGGHLAVPSTALIATALRA